MKRYILSLIMGGSVGLGAVFIGYVLARLDLLVLIWTVIWMFVMSTWFAFEKAEDFLPGRDDA